MNIGERSPFAKGQLLNWVARWMQVITALYYCTLLMYFTTVLYYCDTLDAGRGGVDAHGEPTETVGLPGK